MPCVVFVANRGYALLSSRRELIEHFLVEGWKVVLITEDDRESRVLVNLGAYLERVSVGRGGLAFLKDLILFWTLLKVYRRHKPVLAHHFHAKPVILGSFAARLTLGNKVAVVNTITGLGHAFMVGGMISQMASMGYRLALPWSKMTIFQNSDDQKLFLVNGWVKPDRQCQITGSGIDLAHFEYHLRKVDESKPLVVAMTARLLWQKGVAEFCDVAKKYRNKFPDARFLWAGEEDIQHPDHVSVEWLESQGCIEYLGRISDVRSLLYEADIFLFPSTYREGVPRSVMEAAAAGLPTVAFDVPGVREAVVDGKTGYLVRAGDVDGLLKCVEKLSQNPDLYQSFSIASRDLAEEKFDRRRIHDAYINCYRSLGIDINEARRKE